MIILFRKRIYRRRDVCGEEVNVVNERNEEERGDPENISIKQQQNTG